MNLDFRPHISRIYPDVWNTRGGQHISGIVLFGFSGIAAHLSKDEAFAMADRIVDAAEKLPDPVQVRRVESQLREAQRIISAPRSELTRTNGHPLPNNPAESE